MNMDLGFTPLLIEECKKEGLLRNQAAYLLATCYWETARTMKPVREAYWLSEGWRERNLRYYPWYGRGFIQITWETNYKKASKELGVDFIADPDAVMDPKYSATIAVRGCKEGWFTGKKLSDYITLQKSGFRDARRVVNGMDKASEIARIAENYDKMLLELGYGVEKKKPEPNRFSFAKWFRWFS